MPGVPYLDYVRAPAANPVARAVKLAGLRHNMDETRYAGGGLPPIDEPNPQGSSRHGKGLSRATALEGIGLSEGRTSWRVVVGCVLGSDLPTTALVGLTTSPKSLRTYKTLILDGATLELKRMEPYHEPA